MRSYFSLILTLIVCSSSLIAQEIVSVDQLGSKSKTELNTLFNNPLIRNGTTYYKVDYTSVDANGTADTLSGLMAIPDDSSSRYPILVYQHGTSDCKTCVPSRYGQTGGEEGEEGLLFAGLGYVTFLPDYVGMGDGRGFQTYVHAATSYSATLDMLYAVRKWTADHDVLTNDQLFITGYSQGGYSSMAFQKGMQENFGAKSVSAASHMSGPYSLSGVMRDLILSDQTYFVPAYIPNTVLGMNAVYHVFDSIPQFFKPGYATDIQQYYDGKIGLIDLNTKLITRLLNQAGAIVPKNMIREDILDSIVNRPDYIMNKILKENDVCNWKPESPTEILYCRADNQVPYLNSIVALDSMYARGADSVLVKAIDVFSAGSHATCVTPAFKETIRFFASYQSISSTKTSKQKYQSIAISPNPAHTTIFINDSHQDNVNVSIWDLNGRERAVYSQNNISKGIDISRLENGLYIVRVTDNTGNTFTTKLIVQ